MNRARATTWAGVLGGGLAVLASSAASAQAVPVTVTSQPDGLVLHGVKRASDGTVYGQSSFPEYTPLCTAPCKLTLRPGKQDLGVSMPGASPIVVEDVIIPSRPLNLLLRYQDRSAKRAVGYGFMVLGAVAGTFFIYSGTHSGSTGEENDPLLVSLGVGAFAVTVVGGLVFTFNNLDKAQVIPRPLEARVPTRRPAPGLTVARTF